MSYARRGSDSDVYVYRDVMGGWTVHGPSGTVNLTTLPALRDRLLELRAAGFRVPVTCMERVLRELREGRSGEAP